MFHPMAAENGGWWTRRGEGFWPTVNVPLSVNVTLSTENCHGPHHSHTLPSSSSATVCLLLMSCQWYYKLVFPARLHWLNSGGHALCHGRYLQNHQPLSSSQDDPRFNYHMKEMQNHIKIKSKPRVICKNCLYAYISSDNLPSYHPENLWRCPLMGWRVSGSSRWQSMP